MKIPFEMIWALQGMPDVPDDHGDRVEDWEDNPEPEFLTTCLSHAASQDPVGGLCWL